MYFREASEIMIAHELSCCKLLLVLLNNILSEQGLGVPRAHREVSEVWYVAITIIRVEFTMVVALIIAIHGVGMLKVVAAGRRDATWRRKS